MTMLVAWRRPRRAYSRSGRCPTRISSSTRARVPTQVELVGKVASLREPRTTIGGVNLVAGFRPELWAVVAPGASLSGLNGFNEPVVGADGHILAATQHDVVVWLAGAAYDVVFDVSRGVVSALADRAVLAHEMVGWPYHRDLDLTGFEDGTENPTLVEASMCRHRRARASRRGRKRVAAPAVGARRCPLGRPAGRRAGAGDGSPETRWPGARPEA